MTEQEKHNLVRRISSALKSANKDLTTLNLLDEAQTITDIETILLVKALLARTMQRN